MCVRCFIQRKNETVNVNVASANVMSVFITLPAPDGPANSNKFLFFCTSQSAYLCARIK